MYRKDSLAIISTMVYSISLAFTIPVMQRLLKTIIAPSEYGGLFTSVTVILGSSILLWKTKTISFTVLSSRWKVFFYLAFIVSLSLLFLNLQNQPVSRITGKARSSFEILDLILLVPFAEEMVFRGVIWSMLEKIVKNDNAHVKVLLGTSLLFGIEHLGYWAQTNWPLPPVAYYHATSMIFAGLFFGFVRLKSGLLAIPAVFHMLANGMILLTQ